MLDPKVLVFAGSIRTGSHNARLAALAVKLITLEGGIVTHISLQDFPMPLYDGDLEVKSGPPGHAIQLKRMMMQHAGVFIASSEYNASLTPLLKNTIDWISRVRDGTEPPLSAFRNRIFALAALARHARRLPLAESRCARCPSSAAARRCCPSRSRCATPRMRSTRATSCATRARPGAAIAVAAAGGCCALS